MSVVNSSVCDGRAELCGVTVASIAGSRMGPLLATHSASTLSWR